MPEIVRLVLHDGLAFDTGFVSQASYQLLSYHHVPATWWVNGALPKDRQTQLLNAWCDDLYGPTWRIGNDDGSRYVVLTHHCEPLTPAEIDAHVWRTTPSGYKFFGCFNVSERGELTKILPENFG